VLPQLRWWQASVREGAHLLQGGAGLLDATGAMTHNFRMRETLDRLHHEVAELRASRRRLVLAADADRRMIERELHEGVQQHLVALAVNLQLAEQSADADPAAARALLAEMARDVHDALDETAELARRIYPPLLEAGGLAAALRSAAGATGIRASLEVRGGASYPPEVAAAVYWCCLEAFEHAGAGARATVTVRDEDGAVAFEVVEDGSGSGAGLDRLRDRVEALGGRVTIRSEPGGGTHVAGSLPLSG
jgi:signal transduction histidine kinase